MLESYGITQKELMEQAMGNTQTAKPPRIIKYDMEKSYTTQNNIAKSYLRNPKTYCIHRFNASWGLKPPLKMQLWDMIKKRCERLLGERVANMVFNFLRRLKR